MVAGEDVVERVCHVGVAVCIWGEPWGDDREAGRDVRAEEGAEGRVVHGERERHGVAQRVGGREFVVAAGGDRPGEHAP